MKRYYLCPVIGPDENGEVYAKVRNYTATYFAEIPSDPVTGLPLFSWCLVVAGGRNHPDILADPEIDSLPDFPLDAKIAAMHIPTRTAMYAALEARGVDPSSLKVWADGFREVIRHVGRHLNPNFHEDAFDLDE